MYESIASSLDNLEEISHSISQQDIVDVVKNEQRICFICCNTYTKPEFHLGVAPIHDSITVAEYHQKMGYTNIHLFNPSPRKFIDTFDKLLQMKLEKLTIFYCGHGSKVGNESVLIFDQGYIRASIILNHLRAHGSPMCEKTIIADCCNAESIWSGSNLPANTIVLCSSLGETPSKQAKVFGRDQGLFTYFFWRAYHKNQRNSIQQLVDAANTYLTRFDQSVKVSCTPEYLVEMPLFGKKSRINNNF